jgi:hypothetical protein
MIEQQVIGTTGDREAPGAPRLVQPHTAPEPVSSPLFLESVMEFTRNQWGLIPERVQHSEDGSELPMVQAVLYSNNKGRLTAPRLSPYIPVHFEPTPTQSIARIDRQWQVVGALLAEDMRKRGLASVISLAPEVKDVRPWQWAGFSVEVRFVIHVPLPLNETMIEPSARKKATKAGQSGYTVAQTTRMDEVIACLKSTQARQDFHLNLNEADLNAGLATMGPGTFRTYVCYAPDGEPAAARILLHHPGTRAIDWAGGVNSAHLTAGANQLLIKEMLSDLAASGATAFDFSDATLPSVAAMKANWGGDLVPVYAVDGGRVRSLARHARDYWYLRRRR